MGGTRETSRRRRRRNCQHVLIGHNVSSAEARSLQHVQISIPWSHFFSEEDQEEEDEWEDFGAKKLSARSVWRQRLSVWLQLYNRGRFSSGLIGIFVLIIHRIKGGERRAI